ncbi:MAG: hypothetical protein U1F41_01095 [Burkholderiales bacterium]
MLEHLERRECASELLAVLRIADRIVKRGAGVAYVRRRKAQPLELEMLADAFQALADVADDVRLGDAAFVEVELRRAKAATHDRVELGDRASLGVVGTRNRLRPA